VIPLLPNAERAVIPIEKLRDYVLDTGHPEGRNKAAVFKDVLGIERRHADVLAELIKSTLSCAPAQSAESDEYGDRWTTYHHIMGLNARPAVVTVGWIFRREQSDAPELVTCYIERDKQDKLLELMDL